MSDVLQKEDPNELFKLHLAWVSTLIPFWREAVIRIAELTDTPTDRRDKHLRAIEQSMTLMSAWRFKQIPFIKARQREIDSAISFIRNAALTTKVSKYAFAPVCRNLAGILRSTLRISVFSYHDEQIPEVLAHDIFELATCHTLFPFDTDDFVFFLSSEEPTQTDRQKSRWDLSSQDESCRRSTRHSSSHWGRRSANKPNMGQLQRTLRVGVWWNRLDSGNTSPLQVSILHYPKSLSPTIRARSL